MNSFSDLVEVVRRLRGENGCPWDKEQTHQSLRRHLLEESYEVLEQLDTMSSDAALCDELGDLLFQILLHAQLASERGAFQIADVIAGLERKLIRRHPHVFSNQPVHGTEEVIQNWEKIKANEKPKDSVLDNIPKELPALQRAEKIIDKVSKQGFQWPSLEGPLLKLEEEIQELKAEIAVLAAPASITKIGSAMIPDELRQKLNAELGDVLFCSANIAYFFSINPEDSLRSMLARFESRFRYVEKEALLSKRKLQELSLAEMDKYWEKAKQAERAKS